MTDIYPLGYLPIATDTFDNLLGYYSFTFGLIGLGVIMLQYTEDLKYYFVLGVEKILYQLPDVKLATSLPPK